MEEIKIISKDPLGDEVKKWEKSAEHLLDAKLPVVIRLDGRAFHTFTKNFHLGLVQNLILRKDYS